MFPIKSDTVKPGLKVKVDNLQGQSVLTVVSCIEVFYEDYLEKLLI